METVKTRGIVARKAEYGEANCILTIFTEDFGTVSAICYGVKSKKSQLKSASQILCYSEFVLVKAKGNMFRVESADIIEAFYPISEDIVKLSLANYFLDILRDNFDENDGESLRLLLTSLYFLAYKDINIKIVKAVFELKLMQLSGYEPNLSGCIHCGDNDTVAFDFSGGMVCEKCKNSGMINISKDVKNAMDYILNSEIKKIFSFSVSESVEKTISLITEGYLLGKSEKKYKSLDYYRKMI